MTKGYVTANGANYYYEIHGNGEPLLLLHGGLGSIDMLEPDLAGSRRTPKLSPSTSTDMDARH
jgi:pimeloyl-ACP methyl ester carboxylesterase